MGDEAKGHIPADIVFTLQEKPHKIYQREGNDLIVIKEISLRDALCGVKFEYEHINGRFMMVSIPAVIKPEGEQRYHGLGMPIPKSDGEFGDLVFRFKIRFPSSISPENKELVRRMTFLDA